MGNTQNSGASQQPIRMKQFQQPKLKKKWSFFSQGDKDQVTPPKKNKIKFWKAQTQDDASSLSSYDKISQQVERQCKCSWKVRIIGYLVCCIFGWIISAVSSITFMIRHDPIEFAIYYSFGQICTISGSCFLSTPIEQLRAMAKQTRIILSFLYVGSTLATLLLAIFLPQNLQPLVFITIIVQIVSYFLYTFSYLPFGRAIIRKAFRTAIQ